MVDKNVKMLGQMHKPFVKVLLNKLVALYKIKTLSVDNQLKIKNKLLKIYPQF